MPSNTSNQEPCERCHGTGKRPFGPVRWAMKRPARIVAEWCHDTSDFKSEIVLRFVGPSGDELSVYVTPDVLRDILWSKPPSENELALSQYLADQISVEEFERRLHV